MLAPSSKLTLETPKVEKIKIGNGIYNEDLAEGGNEEAFGVDINGLHFSNDEQS